MAFEESHEDRKRGLKTRLRWIMAVALVGITALTGCGRTGPRQQVVVYTALDQIFSEQILDQFEDETGIDVKPVYDTKATKTVGLVNRILAEEDNPQCDVFRNNEIVRTVVLKRKGLLQPYTSASARDIPRDFKDAEGYWHGFAARARILIYNIDLLPLPSPRPSPPRGEGQEARRDDVMSPPPRSILELTNSQSQGKVSLAYPLFGTTATHAGALFAYWGARTR